MAYPGDSGDKYQIGAVQAGKMPSAETSAMTFFIDLSTLVKTGADIFDTCQDDGGDIRVTSSDGAIDIARDVMSIDTVAKTGFLAIKATGLAVGSTVRVYYNGTATEPASDSTYGSEKAWDSTYDAAYHTSDFINGLILDATANARDMAVNNRYWTHKYDSVSGTGPSAHQCCTYDGSDYYFIDSNYLYKRSTITGANTQTNSDPCGDVDAACDHVSAGETYGNYLYVPVEYYVNTTTYSDQYIARYNKSNLEYVDSYGIAGNAPSGDTPDAPDHECAALTIDPDAGTNGIIYVVSYSDGSKIYKYDLSDFSYIGYITISSTRTKIQGICLDPEGDGFVVSVEGGTEDQLQRIKLNGTYVGSIGDMDSNNTLAAESVFTYGGDIYWWDGDLTSGKVLRKYINIKNLSGPLGGAFYLGDCQTELSTPAGFGNLSLSRVLPDTGSIQYIIQPRGYYDYGAIFDNSVEKNDWEGWTDSAGKINSRINTTLSYTVGAASADYYCHFAWTKDGTSVDQALIVNGTSRASGSDTWVTPGSTFYLNGGNVGNQAGASYYWFVALRNIDISADTDRLTSEYNNQSAPDTFWSFGDEQIEPLSSINLSDTMSVSDDITLAMSKSLSDTVSITDNFSAIITLILALNDTISTTDSIVKEVGLNKSETITMSDEISNTFGLTEADVITIADEFGTSETTIYALLNFIAKNKTFNYNAKVKTFNFIAKPKG